MAQETKPHMKHGAYYFARWSDKCLFDDGIPENAWVKGMPKHYTKKLAPEFAGRTPKRGLVRRYQATHELLDRTGS